MYRFQLGDCLKIKAAVIFAQSLSLLLLLCTSSLKGEHDDFYTRCIIGNSSNKPLCFIYSPKTGYSTLKESLFSKNPINFIYFSNISHLKNKFITVMPVRNPLYRVISIYSEVMKLRLDGDPETTKKTAFYKHRDNLPLSFSLFLDEIKGNFYEPHLCHQYKYLTKKNLTLKDLDFILLFEEMDTDLDLFSQFFNIPVIKLNLNKTPDSIKQPLTDLVNSDPHIQAKIRDLFKVDFKFYEEAKKYRGELLKKLHNN